jgi:hypothetical protein
MLLVVRDATGTVRLPQVIVPNELPDVLSAFAGDWGIDSPFLRLSGYHRTDEGLTELLEFDALHGDRSTAANTFWLPLDHITTVECPQQLGDRLADWAAEQQGASLPPLRAPWALPGWYDKLTQWVSTSLGAIGVVPAGAPRVVQQWGISAVLRQPTDAGDYYVKAVFGAPGRGFWHEPAVTVAFADQQPELIPAVTAIDTDNGWMLMPDMRLKAAFKELPPHDWHLGLRALAQVQRHWIGREAELLALGAPDRSPRHLAAQLPQLLDDELVVSGLEPAERQRVMAAMPTFVQLCAEAQESVVPMTVSHGDCHTGNIGLRQDGTVCVYDWSDAAWGHPFWDLNPYLQGVDADRRTELVDAYLAEWSDLADPAALRRQVRVAMVAGRLYQVASYQGILANLEPAERFIFRTAPRTWWLRTLEALDEVDA